MCSQGLLRCCVLCCCLVRCWTRLWWLVWVTSAVEGDIRLFIVECGWRRLGLLR